MRLDKRNTLTILSHLSMMKHNVPFAINLGIERPNAKAE